MRKVQLGSLAAYLIVIQTDLAKFAKNVADRRARETLVSPAQVRKS